MYQGPLGRPPPSRPESLFEAPPAAGGWRAWQVERWRPVSSNALLGGGEAQGETESALRAIGLDNEPYGEKKPKAGHKPKTLREQPGQKFSEHPDHGMKCQKRRYTGPACRSRNLAQEQRIPGVLVLNHWDE